MIGIHLSALIRAPGISKENHLLAAQIDQESNNVQSLLEEVRMDAKQLIVMPLSQLLSQNVLSLLDKMATTARNAFIGRIDPTTNTLQGGVVQMHENIYLLATYDIAKM